MTRLSILCAASVLSVSVMAQEQTEEKTDDPTQLGVDQKLQEIYELYRVGDVASLRPRQMRFGLGMNYFASEKDNLGLRQSSRSIMGNAFFGYGLTDRVELLVNAPVLWGEHQVSMGDAFAEKGSRFGLANPTVKFLAMLPTKKLQTVGTFAVTLPVGSNETSFDAWHTSIGGNVNWVAEPAFVYGGLTWERDWTNDVNGIGYNAGFSFFVNHTLSIGANFSGQTVVTSSAQGFSTATGPLRGVQVIQRDSMFASIQMSYQATPSFGVSPTIGTGLTDGLPDIVIGMNAFWSF